jgi:hypothetical protein
MVYMSSSRPQLSQTAFVLPVASSSAIDLKDEILISEKGHVSD